MRRKKCKFFKRGSVSISVCKGIYIEKKTLKTCIFLVNIELESAPKKFSFFKHFFKRGREGEGGREEEDGSVSNFLKGEGGSVSISVCNDIYIAKKNFRNMHFSGQY